ncbi:DUF551 domain-containing protein [Escherichia coli]|nr:DUF551 domain-containing protein [Escherichia coli]EEV2803052.1 DUF551 domain-containing protein [Escherichia coli]EEW3303617.1 DUF551 domain-containing protein [Escherichia coli]EFF9227975.1 DUF551 domain-containing protein [Escherichia coli]EFJ6857215.1 DUF551 domain-containing protein [Escherichia coli]
MTTITREQALKIIEAADEVISALAGTNEDVHPGSDNMLRLWDDLNDRYAPPEVVRELARIALASLEAKPIGAFHIAEQQVDGTSDYLKDGEWPIDNGTIEVYAAPPVPVVPEEKPMPNPLSMYAVDAVAAIAEVRGWNACRAAMLHGAEPVSQTYKSQHTQFEQVADLYEMQFDDGRTCAFHTDAQKAAQWLQACDGNRVQEYVKLERLQNALSGNSPVTPDGWISCSERMPKKNQNVLISVNFDSDLVEPLICSARYTGSTFRRGEATIKPGNGVEQVTHWMPLPEPPQEVK